MRTRTYVYDRCGSTIVGLQQSQIHLALVDHYFIDRFIPYPRDTTYLYLSRQLRISDVIASFFFATLCIHGHFWPAAAEVTKDNEPMCVEVTLTGTGGKNRQLS